MGWLQIDPLRGFILACLLIPVGFLAGDGYITWVLTYGWIFYLNNRDYLFFAFCILPSVLGHVATVWGHYYRAEREFQHSIEQVTTPAAIKQKISLWEYRVLWGYTVKYWILVGTVVALNIVWALITVAPSAVELMTDYDVLGGLGLIIGEGSGYAAMACCALILFLVLRRSMLHALGFTYAEILPLHRWLGFGILFWSVVHTVGYIMYYVWDGSLAEAINFEDVDRATMNIMGFIALAALIVLAILSLAQVRRRFYSLFIVVHRIMSVIFLIGTIVHYPYYMLWYYLLPSAILFYIDRFVPSTIQARTLHPEASCTLNADADIIRMTFTSPEPMKPYYPGDYIMIQVPELGDLFHPFTIASYWPEDPRSMVVYVRTYHTTRSWTGAMARLCGTEDKRVKIKSNVSGVFGERRHDYLKSEVLVVFVAGVAVTTFMTLIKAIAAQIAASTEPLRMQFYLICTFRTRSELHAYGSFLHQITRDPRFTSWLHVEVYVSRPDKPKTLMGAHAYVIKNDILVPGPSITKKSKKRFQSLRSTGKKLGRALSGRTINESSSPEHTTKTKAESKHSPSESINTVVVPNEKEKRASSSSSENHYTNLTPTTPTLPSSPISVKFAEALHDPSEVHHRHVEPSSPLQTREMTYDSKRLPTYQDSQSVSVSTRLAKLDLITTAIMIVIPLAFWIGFRAIKWEGPALYCDIYADMTPTQYKVCYGAYSMAPMAGHLAATCIIGYFSNWLARKNLIRSLSAGNFNDVESGKHHQKSNLPYPDFDIEDEKLSVEDGNWDEGDVVYSTGRMDVRVVVERFMNNGVGAEGHDRALVTVFGGGPEGFVDHLERQVKLTKWSVNFHRETWAP